MEAGDLLAVFRQRADDAIAPYHYSDADALAWLSEGEREAAIRARLIYDDASSFTQLAVTAGTALLRLSPLIFHIDAATFTPAGGTAITLDLKGMDWVRDQCDWSTRTSSCPSALVHLPALRKARIWPAPTVAGTLSLAVRRLPLFPMEDGSDEPEIPAEHHDGLIDWALYRAYASKDSEQQDPQAAANSLALFEGRFGSRPDADTLRRQAERRRVTTRCI